MGRGVYNLAIWVPSTGRLFAGYWGQIVLDFGLYTNQRCTGMGLRTVPVRSGLVGGGHKKSQHERWLFEGKGGASVFIRLPQFCGAGQISTYPSPTQSQRLQQRLPSGTKNWQRQTL